MLVGKDLEMIWLWLIGKMKKDLRLPSNWFLPTPFLVIAVNIIVYCHLLILSCSLCSQISVHLSFHEQGSSFQYLFTDTRIL